MKLKQELKRKGSKIIYTFFPLVAILLLTLPAHAGELTKDDLDWGLLEVAIENQDKKISEQGERIQRLEEMVKLMVQRDVLDKAMKTLNGVTDETE